MVLDMLTNKPKWIPLEELNFFGHSLLLKNINTGLWGSGKPVKNEDGSISYNWGYSETPTHYFSF